MKRLVIGAMIVLGMVSCSTTAQQFRANLERNIDPVSIRDRAQYEADLDECCKIASDYTNAHKGQLMLEALGNTHTDLNGTPRPGFVGTADIQRNCMLNRGYLYLR